MPKEGPMLNFNVEAKTDYHFVACTQEEAKQVGKGFEGELDEILFVPSLDETTASRVYIGLGANANITKRSVRNAYAKAWHGIRKSEKIAITIERHGFHQLGFDYYENAVQGILLSSYTFAGYKTEQKPCRVSIHVQSYDEKETLALQQMENLVMGVNQARDLIAQPPNKLFPKELARWVSDYGQAYGYRVKCYGKEELETMGLHAFLSVAQGSKREPRLVVMEYMPVKNQNPIGLVGKALTCDTGGYCLKSASSMPYIKGDMAGAANVIGLMNAIARNKCQINVVAVIAVCENILDGNSFIPGDVITSLANKTIEVVNTDAEGRLTLADALTYIQGNYTLDAVVDIATLTGATATCFGSLYTPVFGNKQELVQEFIQSGETVGEDFWQLPLDDRYKEQILSPIADLKNGGKPSTIAAAMFLQEFIQQTPWLHIDIAATAIQYPIVDAYSKDVASGIGIFSLYHWLNKRRLYYA